MSPTIEGYPRIARVMSEHRELGILRRFGDLNMLTLLHLQAELMHLEEAYEKISETDEKSSSRAYRSRDWWSLTQLNCNGNREQWDLLLQIRETLIKYSMPNSSLSFSDHEFYKDQHKKKACNNTILR
jgi:hypothetical protein